ncbi:Ig-like domain-containing protein [uncultured Roseibium sp.]|uniref:Ig-like domain-containing protein n=1 Tax=uncultured Roseibium sp. TaxID=1936171 RepID=UPI0032175890
MLVDNGAGADRDIDGDTLTVTAGTFATAEGGSVTIDANGAFTYTPAADFNGSDSFTYTVSDGTTTDTGYGQPHHRRDRRCPGRRGRQLYRRRGQRRDRFRCAG